ncbi:hypothetical protein PR048_029023 [Dryococelus australis]|uniref:Uncharacterized protein n=1 Tax=Dryococelus australis TaxID=614101 RepID=A0ABQ9GEU2_9NEOP|nr:hypothetical protein PR048_029023 [Dryococelus australis]
MRLGRYWFKLHFAGKLREAGSRFAESKLTQNTILMRGRGEDDRNRLTEYSCSRRSMLLRRRKINRKQGLLETTNQERWLGKFTATDRSERLSSSVNPGGCSQLKKKITLLTQQNSAWINTRHPCGNWRRRIHHIRRRCLMAAVIVARRTRPRPIEKKKTSRRRIDSPAAENVECRFSPPCARANPQRPQAHNSRRATEAGASWAVLAGEPCGGCRSSNRISRGRRRRRTGNWSLAPGHRQGRFAAALVPGRRACGSSPYNIYSPIAVRAAVKVTLSTVMDRSQLATVTQGSHATRAPPREVIARKPGKLESEKETRLFAHQLYPRPTHTHTHRVSASGVARNSSKGRGSYTEGKGKYCNCVSDVDARTTRLPPTRNEFDSPDFRMRESCRKMPLVGAFFFVNLPFPPLLHSGPAPYSSHFTLIGSQDLHVKSRPNHYTPVGLTNEWSLLYSYSHAKIFSVGILDRLAVN